MARNRFTTNAGSQPSGKLRTDGVWITSTVAAAAVAGAILIVAIPQPLASTMPAPWMSAVHQPLAVPCH